MLGYDNDEGLKRWKTMRMFKCRGDFLNQINLRVAGDRYNGALDDGKHCSEALPEGELISEVLPEGELITPRRATYLTVLLDNLF